MCLRQKKKKQKKLGDRWFGRPAEISRRVVPTPHAGVAVPKLGRGRRWQFPLVSNTGTLLRCPGGASRPPGEAETWDAMSDPKDPFPSRPVELALKRGKPCPPRSSVGRLRAPKLEEFIGGGDHEAGIFDPSNGVPLIRIVAPPNRVRRLAWWASFRRGRNRPRPISNSHPRCASGPVP